MSEKDYAELKAEKDRLKEEMGGMQILINNYIALTEKYHLTLQEIKAIVKKNINYQDTDSTTRAMTKIINLITKAEEE